MPSSRPGRIADRLPALGHSACQQPSARCSRRTALAGGGAAAPAVGTTGREAESAAAAGAWPTRQEGASAGLGFRHRRSSLGHTCCSRLSPYSLHLAREIPQLCLCRGLSRILSSGFALNAASAWAYASATAEASDSATAKATTC